MTVSGHDAGRMLAALDSERRQRRAREEGAMVLPMAGLAAGLLALCLGLVDVLGAAPAGDTDLARRAASAAASALRSGQDACAAARASVGSQGSVAFCAVGADEVVVSVVPHGSSSDQDTLPTIAHAPVGGRP